MKRVYSALNLPDAHIVANLLTQAGIAVQIFNVNAAGALGELPVDAAQPQVWVEDDIHESRARALIESHQKHRVQTAQQPCHQCGELNPGNFEVCWNCGAALAPL
jgi:hypothetical protein